MRSHSNQPGNYRCQRGFTLLEAMVVLAAFGAIMVVAFQLFGQLGAVAIGNDQVARSQAGARVAIEEVERHLRSAGAELDLANGQRTFVHAAPFALAFNANIMPLQDPTGNGVPSAIAAGSANAGVPSDGAPLYSPPVSYTTGAETILFTLDSNRNGILDAADKGDDLEEQSTNPNDYVLYRNIYGFDGTANVVDSAPLAVVRGPEMSEAAEYVPPMFSYWLDDDDDSTTPPVLFGDANGDGEITVSEAANLTALNARDLARVERVAVTITSETATPNPARNPDFGGYQRVTMASEVAVRQQPRSSSTIFGSVFKDLNGNGTREANEPTISGVVIQASTGLEARTGPQGEYILTIPPGQVTVSEVDPTGYHSSTPNDAAVDAYPGSYHRIDFGDVPAGGLGSAYGFVFNDENQNGIRDGDERGIANVKVYSDSGEYTYTSGIGSYRLDVPTGVRTIAEVDSTGYVSSTPNSVEADISSDGVSIEVNFGDYLLEETGTIQGYVFEDRDADGVRDNNETGVPGATIIVDATTTESDNQGFFSLTVPAGTHNVIEQDPPGYTSTTPNTLRNIRVEPDQVINVAFGDYVEEDIDFDVIDLADTEKALSIASGDLDEDSKGDADLILGTRFSGGANNLLVWHNSYRNSRTPNSAIFSSTPSFTRANTADVTSLVAADVDDDNEIDLISGLALVGGLDLNVWLTNSGLLENSPDHQYASMAGAIIWDICVVDFDENGTPDLALAIEEDSGGGHVEFWHGLGGGEFVRADGATLSQGGALGEIPFGGVRAIGMSDIDADGKLDLVVAESRDFSASNVHVFTQRPFGLGWNFSQNFKVQGVVTRLDLVDMVEDDQQDIDIVLAVETSSTTGGVELWHRHEDGYYGLLGESGRSLDDFMVTGGAPLSLIVTRLDNDIFPDVVVGIRNGSGYDGTVKFARAFGHLPAEPESVSASSLGAVMTMTESDFNKDGVSDLAAGTQNSSTSGKVFILFRR